MRCLWRADRCAQFHHGLVPVACGLCGSSASALACRRLPAPCLAQIAANRFDPRDHPRHISVQHRELRAVGDAQDCRYVYGPIPGKSSVSSASRGNIPPCLATICLPRPANSAHGCNIRVPTTAAAHLLPAPSASACTSGNRSRNRLEVGNHRRHSRLLQHDFRKPDAIGIFRCAAKADPAGTGETSSAIVFGTQQFRGPCA